MAETVTYPGDAGQGANLLKNLFSDEIPLNPTEEAIIADFTTDINGGQKMGNELTVRKIPTVTRQNLGTTAGNALTDSTTAEANVTMSVTANYGFISLSLSELTRAVDEAKVRSGYSEQIRATLREGLETSIFSLVSSFSNTETAADFDVTMMFRALKKVAKSGKGRAALGKTEFRLVIHPDEIDNALATKEFSYSYIRGNATGAATTGWSETAYGVQLRESGLVTVSGSTAYCPLVTREALWVAWNQRPTMLDVQPFQMVQRYIGWQEYGVARGFDQFGAQLACTVP